MRAGKLSPPSGELRYHRSPPSTVSNETSPVTRAPTCGKVPVATPLGLASNRTGPIGAEYKTNAAAPTLADRIHPFIIASQRCNSNGDRTDGGGHSSFNR